MVDKEEFFSPQRHSPRFRSFTRAPVILAVNGSEYRWIMSRLNRRAARRRKFQLARACLVSAQFLMIESLQKFHHYYGDGFKVSVLPAPASKCRSGM